MSIWIYSRRNLVTTKVRGRSGNEKKEVIQAGYTDMSSNADNMHSSLSPSTRVDLYVEDNTRDVTSLKYHFKTRSTRNPRSSIGTYFISNKLKE